MGKKGGWFAALKRVFVAQSKEKLVNEGEAKIREENKKKKKGLGKLRHGERTSFIPLFKEPSSIEKILGEAEKEHDIIFRPPTPPEQSTTPPFVPSHVVTPRVPSPRVASPRVASPRPASSSPPSPRVASPRAPSQRIVSPRAPSPRVDSPQAASQRIVSPGAPPLRVDSPQAASQRIASPRAPPRRVASPQAASQRIASPRNTTQKEIQRSESTLRDYDASAIKIQAFFRGYMARRSFRALRGLVRLQGVVQGPHVKRQTMNAMKQMQLLVRVQSQIHSRRIQMLENQAQQDKNEKDVESTIGKLSTASEAGNPGDWENSVLTKEEVEARLHRKVEAVIKRERAMSYAYSHQPWKSSSKSKGAVFDIRSGGFPVWWNWLERQLHPENHAEDQPLKNYRLTPGRTNSELKSSSRPPSRNYKQSYSGYENMDSFTPRSSRSSVVVSLKQPRTPPSGRMLQGSSSSVNKYPRSRASGAESPFNVPLKDDESLISCPPFSVRNYMAPTVSAKAKVRASSNPKERFPGTPSNDPKRRFSFPLTQGIGSFKMNNGKESSSKRILDSKHQSLDVSVDSTVSLPPGVVGRKPFNRFV